MKPPFTAGLADFAGADLDKAAAATGLGAELKAIGTIKRLATGKTNVTISLGTNLDALGTKTIGFEVGRE
ncbi:hypothetical protein C0995_008665, partial [Termitomyces sp. Mi166